MPAEVAPWFVVLLLAAAIVSGATASVVGFGIGSLLTPVFAMRYGTDTAIAAVALPHFAGGLLRGWRLRASVDRGVLWRFGLLSALAGLVGAFAFSRLAPLALTHALGALLLLTATAGLTGWSQRWRPQGAWVWALGALSGFFGGVAGNQGGLRAAALSAFGLAPAAFVATSTVIGVLVDVVRTPVYLASAGSGLAAIGSLVALAGSGVVLGTLLGERLLFGLSPERFRRAVSAAVGLLGLWFLLKANAD
jgi:uncharacterized membrane protein YfcA